MLCPNYSCSTSQPTNQYESCPDPFAPAMEANPFLKMSTSICTHTHVYTHMYIYNYIYIYTSHLVYIIYTILDRTWSNHLYIFPSMFRWLDLIHQGTCDSDLSMDAAVLARRMLLGMVIFQAKWRNHVNKFQPYANLRREVQDGPGTNRIQ